MRNFGSVTGIDPTPANDLHRKLDRLPLNNSPWCVQTAAVKLILYLQRGHNFTMTFHFDDGVNEPFATAVST